MLSCIRQFRSLDELDALCKCDQYKLDRDQDLDVYNERNHGNVKFLFLTDEIAAFITNYRKTFSQLVESFREVTTLP